MNRLLRMLFLNVVLMAEANDTGGGGGGNDTVGGGGGGNDTAGGGASGNSTVSGGSGSDTVQSGAGNDTVAGGSGGQIKFPDNWRDGLAGSDPRKAERLSRYGTPQAVADALISVQERISKGELRSNVPFPDKGTDQEKTAWRAEQGIPVKAEDYYPALKLDGDRKIPDEDKAKFDPLIQRMHGANATPAQTAAAIDTYYSMVEQETNRRAEQDKKDVEDTRDTMVAKMGLPEFKANYNLVQGMFEMVPAKVKDALMYGRLSNGKPILGDPDVFEGLTHWARQINPAAALVPNASGNTAGAIDDQIKAYEKMMRDDRAGWNKDDKAQKHYRDLIDARDRAKVKA